MTKSILSTTLARGLAVLGLAAAVLLAWTGSSAGAQAASDAQLTVAVQSSNSSLDFTFAGNSEVFILSNAESETVSLSAGEPVEIAIFPIPADYFINRGRCTGTPGLSIDQNGTIVGSLPAGAIARCDYQILKKTPVTMTVAVDAGADASTPFPFTFRPNPRFAYPGFTLTGGQTQTFDAFTGDFMKLLAFETPGWSYAGGFCSGDDAALFVSIDDLAIFEGTLLQGVTEVTCTVVVERTEPLADGVYPTVTCLAGNGRIDVNVVNTDTTAHRYQLNVGNLSARTATVAAGDWWRSPVTGRADGPIDVVLTRDGAAILDTTVQVNCDSATPAVSNPEVQILNVCRGGNGFIAWQFANPRAARSGYVIAFDGVPNRSTSAAAFGASVRGVSGRPDGTYNYTIFRNGSFYEQSTVTVDCD